MLSFPACQTPTPLYFRLRCSAECWRLQYGKKLNKTKKTNSAVRFKPKIILLVCPPTSSKLLCNLKKIKSSPLPGEGQRTLAASSLTTAAGLHGSCFFFSSTSSFLLLSSRRAPLHNCFTIFTALRVKVNNVRNYLKYTRRARRVPSSCVGSAAFRRASAM